MKQPCSQKPPAEGKKGRRPLIFNGEKMRKNTRYSELLQFLYAQTRARVVPARARTRFWIRHRLRLIPNLVGAAAAGWDVT